MGDVQLGKRYTDEETAQIVAFLKTLTGEQPKIVLPVLPPSGPETPEFNPWAPKPEANKSLTTLGGRKPSETPSTPRLLRPAGSGVFLFPPFLVRARWGGNRTAGALVALDVPTFPPASETSDAHKDQRGCLSSKYPRRVGDS